MKCDEPNSRFSAEGLSQIEVTKRRFRAYRMINGRNRLVVEKALSNLEKDSVITVNISPQWIPVTERLPETRVPVLTYGRKGAIGIGFVQPTSVAADGRIYFYARYGDSLPTHWMPLPQAPEDGGDENA